jgi:hypothetical protein
MMLVNIVFVFILLCFTAQFRAIRKNTQYYPLRIFIVPMIFRTRVDIYQSNISFIKITSVDQ